VPSTLIVTFDSADMLTYSLHCYRRATRHVELPVYYQLQLFPYMLPKSYLPWNIPETARKPQQEGAGAKV